MRVAVSPDLASQAHQTAATAAYDAHEPRLAARCERRLRAATREAVATFERHNGELSRAYVAFVVEKPYQPPTWRFPLEGDLIDEQRVQADLETEARDSREAAGATVSETMGMALGLDFETRNALLEGVIAGQSGMHITTASQDLTRVLMARLQQSYDDGDSIPRAARHMRKAGYQHSQSYAVRIARTELIGAVNGSSLAMVKGGTDIEYKLWMSTGDNRTRPTHRDAEGQVRKLDEPFTIGGHYLMYPGDPGGPGDEVIQCRCTMGYTDDPLTAGGTMAVVEKTEEGTEVGAAWGGPIAQEGVDTGDLRRIEPGALNHRKLPLTLMSQLVTPEWGGHADAAVAGRIDSIDRAGEDIVGGGVFDLGEHGAETERMVRTGMLKGVSVDLAINKAEMIPDPDIEDEIEAYFMGTLNILDATILGATVVPFPAFENATIAIIAGAYMRVGQQRKMEAAAILERYGVEFAERRVVVSFCMPFAPALTASGQGPAVELSRFTVVEAAPTTDEIIADGIANLERGCDVLRQALDLRGPK